MSKQLRTFIRRVLPHLAVVVAWLVIVAPKPTLFDIQRWLEKGDEALQNQELDKATDYYGRAEQRGAVLNISSASSPPNTIQTSDDLVLLLTETEQTGWSDTTRRQYADYRQMLGSSQPMLALFGLDPDALGDDIIPVLYDLATTEMAKENWDAAVEYFEALLILEPDNEETNYLLGMITIIEDTRLAFGYFDALDRESAHIDTIDKLREVVLAFSNPATDADYQSLGLVLIELEEWVFAERAFNAAIALEQDWLSYTYRGFARDHITGKNGFEDYGNALALSPNSSLIYYFLGLHWRQGNNLEDSRDAFLNAYFLETTNPAYAIETGIGYRLLGNNIAAEDWFNIAVALEPDNLQWQQVRAAFYADEAFALETGGLTAIQEAYDFAPEDPDILTSLGYAYFQLEDFDMAQNYLAQATTIAPTNARAQYIYGLTLMEQQDAEAAIDAFLQAVDVEGTTTGYGLKAARSLQQLGITLP